MSTKYRPGVVESFIDHYATGLYTLKELCKQVNISTSTYYFWKEHVPEFQKKLAEAETRKMTHLKELATKGLVKLITGVEIEEVSEEYELPPPAPKYSFLDDDDPLNELIAPVAPVPILKKRFITKKVIMPNHQSVIFTLRNADSTNFPDDKTLNVGAKANTQPIPIAFIPPPGLDFSFPTNTDDSTITGAGNDAPANDV